MKKTITILVSVVVVGVLVFLGMKFDLLSLGKGDGKGSGGVVEQDFSRFSQTPEQQAKSTEEKVVENTLNTKEFVGIIKTVSAPKDFDVRYLKIEADVVDSEGLKDVDFSKKATSLPMIRDVFDVAVDNSTKLTKINDKGEIKPGSMVRVVSGRSIYESKQFTAVEVELIATR